MDTKRIKEIFNEIELMAGNSLGVYLRNGGRNFQELNRIFEDEFTCTQVEALKTSLDSYILAHQGDIEAMDPEFKDQHNQIMAMRSVISLTIGDLNYKISNLPNLLESVIQAQFKSIYDCYTQNHKQDFLNMKMTFNSLKEQGLQETDANKEKFTVTYLKAYFRKLVATSISSGAYKKYKVGVINRFHERYEEMLAG
ncbi:MAG: hypothetical protein KF802_02840 [Bdellovibrionaceae bacterium]|nr:hypothetical protein [Pseudobdellovibrionaceae bacterium]